MILAGARPRWRVLGRRGAAGWDGHDEPGSSAMWIAY
jgi:hypothetical protein